MPLPAAKATQYRCGAGSPAGTRAGWKLPIGGSTSIVSPTRNRSAMKRDTAPPGCTRMPSSRSRRARGIDDRIRPALLAPVEHDPERDVLSGVRGHMPRENPPGIVEGRSAHRILGGRGTARELECVEPQHSRPGSVALETVERFETAFAAVQSLAGRRAELAQAARRLRAAAGTSELAVGARRSDAVFASFRWPSALIQSLLQGGESLS